MLLAEIMNIYYNIPRNGYGECTERGPRICFVKTHRTKSFECKCARCTTTEKYYKYVFFVAAEYHIKILIVGSVYLPFSPLTDPSLES
jgi:hypothetical protein